MDEKSCSYKLSCTVPFNHDGGKCGGIRKPAILCTDFIVHIAPTGVTFSHYLQLIKGSLKLFLSE